MNAEKFRYVVQVEMKLSVEEASFLKRTAEQHYDYKVRDSAKAGAINGLYNTANWEAEDHANGVATPEGIHTSAVTTHELDTMLKALEQWQYGVSKECPEAKAAQMAIEMRSGILAAMNRCYARRHELEVKDGKS